VVTIDTKNHIFGLKNTGNISQNTKLNTPRRLNNIKTYKTKSLKGGYI